MRKRIAKGNILLVSEVALIKIVNTIIWMQRSLIDLSESLEATYQRSMIT